jgi:hypothetical protein
MQKRVLITTCIISFLMIPFLIHAEVYKWIDEKGTIHFTDDYSNIPEKYLPFPEAQGSPKESSPPIPEEKSAPVLAPKRSGSPELEMPRLFSGLISGVDDSARSVAVTGDGEEMVFTVSEDTILRNDSGKSLSFSELKNDRPVTIEYIEKGGELQARSVTVSILQAGATNAVEDNQAPGPGQLENPGKTQQGVWDDQQAHQTFPDGTPTKPSQFKLPKK